VEPVAGQTARTLAPPRAADAPHRLAQRSVVASRANQPLPVAAAASHETTPHSRLPAQLTVCQCNLTPSSQPTMRKTPILVTGAHRSGPTWAGKMLNLSPYTDYIGEVLRPHTSLLDPNPVRHRYQHDDPERNRALHRGFKRLLAYNFS